MSACEAGQFDESAGGDTQTVGFAENLPPNAPKQGGEEGEGEMRKLLKEGRMEWEAEDLEGTRARVLFAVERYKGYLSRDEVHRGGARLSHEMEIRVPAENFDSLMAKIGKGVEEFDLRQVTVKDVTEEFLDVEARLKTKKELEARYLGLLEQAKTVTEILEIEKEIGTLRADIESIEGRLNYLKDRIRLSTLQVTFYETLDISDSWADRFGTGFGNGWRNLVWFFVGLVNIWPFILLGFLVFFLLHRLTRKKKPKPRN